MPSEREELIELIGNYAKNNSTTYHTQNTFGDSETVTFYSNCHIDLSGLADAILEWHKKDEDKLLIILKIRFLEIEMYREEILRLGGSLKKGKFGITQQRKK